jgi:hypothetical protein
MKDRSAAGHGSASTLNSATHGPRSRSTAFALSGGTILLEGRVETMVELAHADLRNILRPVTLA